MLLTPPVLTSLIASGLLGVAALVTALPLGRVDRRHRIAATLAALAAVTAFVVPLAWAASTLQAPEWQSYPIAFVAALGAVVQSFGRRQLRAEPRQWWFATAISVLTASVIVMIAAPTVLVFAAAWTIVGLALVALLRLYPGLPQAARATRATATAEAIGLGALWSAVVWLLVREGADIPVGDLAGAVAGLPADAATALALLLVVAGLARSGQVPFAGWLPTTVVTPAPVSAIMHAGVVNGMTFLVIFFSPLVATSLAAMAVIFAAGAASLAVGIAGMIVRPDVKGRLVASTTAQMGFMVMTLGVGAFAVAIFHLMGHGLYKATLFLRAGSVIDDARLALGRRAPALPPLPQTVVALTLPGAAILATTLALHPQPSATTLLLALFGCATGAALLLAWFSSPGLSGLLQAAGALAVAGAGSLYAVVIAAAEVALAPPVPTAIAAVPGVWIAVVLGAALLLSTLGASRAASSPALFGALLGLAGTPVSRRTRRARPLSPVPSIPENA